MKIKIVTGTGTITAGGTAQQLTSTAYRAVLLYIECVETQAIAVGDSNVAFSATPGSQRGLTVSDGTGAGANILSATITAPGASDVGGNFHQGAPWFDLSDVYLDGTTAEACSWYAMVLA